MPEFELLNYGVGHTLRNMQGQRIFKASFEVTAISGEGDYHSPHLYLPVRIEQQMSAEQLTLSPLEFTLSLFLGHPSSAPPPVFGLLGTARLIPQPRTSPIGLRLPLTPWQVARIEDTRSGKDLDLTIYLQALLAVRTGPQSDLEDIEYSWGMCGFTIPRSHWVDHILPRLGYMSRYLLEIPLPASADLRSVFENAMTEFTKAENEYRHDNFSAVLVDCRNTIDALVSFRPLELGGKPASFSNRTEAFAQQHLEPRLGSQTKAQFVASQLTALWSLLSAETKPGPFLADRQLAGLVLHTTANLLGYLGKALSP